MFAHAFVQSLTGGSGFYLTDSKETLWPSRRLVVQNKKTGGRQHLACMYMYVHVYTHTCIIM